MAFWISLRDQLIALWTRWSLGQRVGFSAATLACVGAIVGTMIWASQPEYVVIANQLTPKRASEIVSVLDTEKIGYQLNFSSSAVSVASGDVGKARMALKDVIEPEEQPEDSDASMFPFPTPGGLADRRRSNLEKRIATNLTRIYGVRSVSVSIGQPDPSPFVDGQSPVTAAIVVEATPGESLTASRAQAIISHVANSVPGLTSRNIVLTDTNGRQFGHRDEISHGLEMQLEFRREYENRMVQRLEEFLNSAEGVQARVTVTADIDFSSQKTTESKFDPDGKVKLKETIDSHKQDHGVEPPVGTPGVATNIPADANARSQSGGKTTSELIDVEYGNSVTSLEVEDAPGKVRRLSVAAFIDVRQPPADPNAPQATPPLVLQQQQFESLLRAAVGIDEERNDTIEVVLTPLAALPVEDPVVGGFVWEQWQPLVQSISLGLAASLAFLIGMMLMKRMKPIVITQTLGPGIPLADARRLASISEQAKANPEIVANILSAWLNEQDQPATDAAQPTTAPAQKVSAVPSTLNASVPRSAASATGTPGESRKAA